MPLNYYLTDCAEFNVRIGLKTQRATIEIKESNSKIRGHGFSISSKLQSSGTGIAIEASDIELFEPSEYTS